MTERAALLRAVCENPDDDTPRLVFADWLQERGDETDRARAELIRIQVEMAAIKEHAIANRMDWRQSGAWQHLGEREMVLLRTHDEEWWRELPNAPGYCLQRLFRRGFVNALWVSEWGAFVRDAEAVLSATPVTALHVRGSVHFGDLDASGYLSRFQELDLTRATLARKDVDFLSTTKALTRLKHITISQMTLTQEMLRNRLAQRYGARLRHSQI